MADIEGSAVTIYNGNEAFMEKLHSILDQDNIRDLPIVVIPVAGEFRTGKSFMLSYFLRYLTKQNFGSENDKLVGFDHKCSSKSVTQGIKVWGEPLIVDNLKEDGSTEKIVVLLMDSQGILGGKGDKEEASRIFALTTMISSIMVFNLMGQLNEGVLSHLEMFTAYAKQATAEDTDGSPFQKLLILIRDWSKREDHPYGFNGGKTYMEEYFEERDEDDNLNEENVFDNFFKDIDCYLMPRPGDCIENKKYNGCLKELKDVFKIHLKELTARLLKPEQLAQNLKVVAGNTITAGNFCKYFEDCTKLMVNVDWKKSTNMLKMNTKFNCEFAKKEAHVEYVTLMDKETASFINMDTQEFMTVEELVCLSRRSSDKAKTLYGVKGVFALKNDPTLYAEYETQLIEEVKIEFPRYQEKFNTDRQIMITKEKEYQAEAIEEARRMYKDCMGRETSLFMTTASTTFLEEEEFKSIDNDAQAKAIKHYEDKCKAVRIIFLEKYRENEKKLTEELEEESKQCRCVQDVLRMQAKDKEILVNKMEEDKAEFDNKLKKEKEESDRKIQETKSELSNKLQEEIDAAEIKRNADKRDFEERLQANKTELHNKLEADLQEERNAAEEKRNEDKRDFDEKLRKEKEEADKKLQANKTELDNKLKKSEEKGKEDMQKEKNAAEEKRNEDKKDFDEKMRKNNEMNEFFEDVEGDNLRCMPCDDGTTVHFDMSKKESFYKAGLATPGRWLTLNNVQRIDSIWIYNVDVATRRGLRSEFDNNGGYMNMQLIKKVLQTYGKTLEKTERTNKRLGCVGYKLWLD